MSDCIKKGGLSLPSGHFYFNALAVAGLSPGCAKAKGHATRTDFQPVPIFY
ncbi:hypothetical protein [Moorena sp. SIO4G3]|uniref:hypothetical protein n=1 Tax=Moorena sp. SIO4G3 TaxID=2607821 RepID=UPI00142957C0|nr:hypothetical protein [Moorena sp. SIO4G3]NEO75776.1 hypothetical protein [Moorena sp. SIO4G3]